MKDSSLSVSASAFALSAGVRGLVGGVVEVGLDVELGVVSSGEVDSVGVESDVEGEVVSSGEEGSVVSSVFAVVAVEESPFDGSIVPFPLSQPLVSKNSDATNRQSSISKVFDVRTINLRLLGECLYRHLITVPRYIEQHYEMT